MSTKKFDIIEVQTLKVSGADKIENVVDVTEQLVAMDGATIVKGFTFAAAAGAANVVNVTITAVDGNGVAVPGVRHLEVYCSDSATGAAIASTMTPDTITASTGGILSAITANLHLSAVTDANGVLVLVITDTGTPDGYVCVVDPLSGEVSTGAVVTADYGT
jgi:hypothetical protein